VPRDRRWDYLYDRQRQPVKTWLLERFAEDLAGEVAAWPPPFVDWVSDELRARWAAGAAARPRDEVVRLALAAARLDLARDYEGVERLLDADRERLRPGEPEAVHLLVRFLTEKSLALKEHAEGARLTRADLDHALSLVERRLFRVIS
jgi:hypothetical protein